MAWYDPIGVTGMISSFLHPEQGYEDAMAQMEKYFGQAQGYENPFIANAGGVYPQLSSAMSNLLNPAALENQWASGYQASPYATQMEKEAQDQGMNAASSMGLMGSSPAIQNIQKTSGDVMQQFRQQYMNDLMQKYMSGIGVGQNIYGTGAGAAGNMSELSMRMGQNMGQGAYGAATAPGQLFGQMLGTGADLAMGGMPGMMGGMPMMGGASSMLPNMMQRPGYSGYGGYNPMMNPNNAYSGYNTNRGFTA